MILPILDGVPAGCAQLYLGAESAGIYDVAVLPGCRGLGLGRFVWDGEHVDCLENHWVDGGRKIPRKNTAGLPALPTPVGLDRGGRAGPGSLRSLLADD